MDKYLEYFKKDQFAATNGIILVECKPGYAIAKVKINESHLNGAGVVHGGLLFTLADFAFAASVNAYGKVTLSVSNNISYFQAGHSGEITAEAIETSRSNRLIHCNINIMDDQGVLLANFKGTAYITKHNIDF